MFENVTFSIQKTQTKALDKHPLRKDLSRSSLVRLALTEFLNKGQKEEKETKETKEEG
jgi:hypothetical protein